MYHGTMNTSATTISDLSLAASAFRGTLGKHEISKAIDLLETLNLGDEAEGIVLEIIEKAFAQDAFAGYLRFEGIASTIEVTALRRAKSAAI